METITVTTDGNEVTTSGSDLDTSGPISIVQIALPNQTVQVQPLTDGDTDDEADGLVKKRREILARRPSYRKILNDLSADQAIQIAKIEEESPGSQGSQDSSEGNEAATNLGGGVQYQTTVMPAQIQIGGGDAGTPGLQTLTMTNVNSSAAATAGTTIVQYAQGPDGQFFIPVSNLSANTVQAYQIASPSSLGSGVVMATAGSPLSSPQHLTEEVSRKRELRLLKNRDAARECRRKKKEYVKCLENRVAVLENQNKALIEELKSLKELYCQKEG